MLGAVIGDIVGSVYEFDNIKTFNGERYILKMAKISAECTHNHPEGIKGAQATALCIYMARND